jgi:nucleotide-binding universal stress UspA family protein
MTPLSLLAITDFSDQGDHALARAAHLCAQHGGTLKLLCVAYPGEPPPPDALSRLAHHALQLERQHGLDVRYVGRIAVSIQDLVASARCADLLVWGTAPSRSVRAFLTGQPVEGVLRQYSRPILVVRRPARRPYGSLIVAVDFSEASHGLVELGFTLNPDARVELFHAISTSNEGKLRYAEVSEQAIAAYRKQCLRYAQDQMFWLTDSYDARRNRVLSSIRQGSPARQVQVQQERSGSELIVVGKHPASAVSDFLFGSTAQRVLRESAADVLVVPHAYERGLRATARTRSASQPWTVRRLRAGPPQAPARPNPAALPAKFESS